MVGAAAGRCDDKEEHDNDDDGDGSIFGSDVNSVLQGRLMFLSYWWWWWKHNCDNNNHDKEILLVRRNVTVEWAASTIQHAPLSFTTTIWHQVSSDDNDYNDENHDKQEVGKYDNLVGYNYDNQGDIA